MSDWREDVSTCTLEEVLQRQAENRGWGKELRMRADALVNSRLAKAISQDDYLARRQLDREDAVECRRRAAILDKHLTSCTGHSMPLRARNTA